MNSSMPIKKKKPEDPSKETSKRPTKKILQVPVIVGFGEKQELVVKESVISPPSPSVFRIKDVDKEVVITNFKLIPTSIFKSNDEDDKSCWWAKVIVDGFIDKNVNYKTITDYECNSVNGPLFHFTTKIEFATFVEVKATSPIVDTDRVEILSAFVEGEKEELLDPNPAPEGAPSWAITYNKLLEKMIVKITLKVVRIEHVPVTPDP